MSTASHNDNSKFLQEMKEHWSREEFLLPDGYFSGLAESIEMRMLLQEKGIPLPIGDEFLAPEGHLKEMRTSLSKATGYSLEGEQLAVPDGYFQDLSAEIMSKLAKEDAPPEVRKAVSLGSLRKLWTPVAIAASLLAAVFIWSGQEPECETFACLLERSEIGYEDLEYFTTEELGDFLIEESSKDKMTDEAENDVLDYLLESDMNIEEYLDDYEYEYE